MGYYKPFMIVYMAVCHVAAVYGAYLAITVASWPTLALAVLFYWLSGAGITIGAHRLYSHRSFTATTPISIANQGSMIHWVRDHRVHHRHSETTADPHNAKRGFFFAHMGWLFVQKHKDVIEAGKSVGIKDLWNDPFVAFQERNKHWVMPVCCFVLPASIVSWFTADTYMTGLFVVGFLRYVLVLHATWCVNSVAHLVGYRPYNPKINPSEHTFVDLVTGGEGAHNFHHVYPHDYSASEFDLWGMQWNWSTLIIDTWAALGLVSNRKKATVKRDANGKIIPVNRKINK